jgi:hypothetical protein
MHLCCLQVSLPLHGGNPMIMWLVSFVQTVLFDVAIFSI